MTNRRNFLKNGLSGLALTALPSTFLAANAADATTLSDPDPDKCPMSNLNDFLDKYPFIENMPERKYWIGNRDNIWKGGYYDYHQLIWNFIPTPKILTSGNKNNNMKMYKRDYVKISVNHALQYNSFFIKKRFPEKWDENQCAISSSTGSINLNYIKEIRYYSPIDWSNNQAYPIDFITTSRLATKYWPGILVRWDDFEEEIVFDPETFFPWQKSLWKLKKTFMPSRDGMNIVTWRFNQNVT